MANAERGEVALVAGTTEYTLVLSMNAICEMESRTGKTYGGLVLSMQALDFQALRNILWMTLKKYHAKDFETVESVGALIDELPAGPASAIEALTTLFRVNESRGQKKTDPPTAT